MKIWLQQHLTTLQATLARLAGSPFATLLNALAIGITLLLPLGAYVVLDNLQRAAGHLNGDPQLSVYMALDADPAAAKSVESTLQEAEAVRGFRWIGRDAALAEMKDSDQLTEVLALLPHNPLPDAFVVDLDTGTLHAAQQLADRLQALPGVAEVQLDTLWIQRLDAMLRVGRAALILLGSILAFALAAVTFNTVRMQILTQRDEIEVAKVVGATDSWVRRPFYYQGALLGLLGTATAVALLAGSIGWLNRELAPIGQSYGLDLKLLLPTVTDLLTVSVFAAALGWLGAHISVSKHLRSH